MYETIAFSWKMLLIPLAVLLYFQLLSYLDMKYARTRRLSDEECLAKLARLRNCSEYDLFFDSAKGWHIPECRIEHDFRHYLTQARLPYYVKDFIRKTRADIEHHPSQ